MLLASVCRWHLPGSIRAWLRALLVQAWLPGAGLVMSQPFSAAQEDTGVDFPSEQAMGSAGRTPLGIFKASVKSD